jgi:DNA-binding LacI/PurR family transcriptional regulator
MSMSIVAVAKRAGVSVATVSRVINDLNNVRAETVEQVRAAMSAPGSLPFSRSADSRAGWECRSWRRS